MSKEIRRAKLAREATKIYDEMSPEAQDMPRETFVKEYCRLTDPEQFSADAKNFMDQRRMIKSRMVNEKARIDRAIRRRNNG